MLCMSSVAPHQFKKEFRDTPQCNANEVLIRLKQVGICGSDIQINHGLHPVAQMPLIMGHECVGVVEAIGENVTNVHCGDLVTVQPQLMCGTCYACTHETPNVCENLKFMGVRIDGFFCEYAVVPAWNVLPLPQSMPLDAAMLAEPVAVAINAARKAGARKGLKAAIIGAGTIGNLVAQACSGMGAQTLITDIQDKRLEIAKRCGVDFAVNTGKVDLETAFSQCFGKDGPDVILDCAAVPAVFHQIMNQAKNGTKIVVVGNYKKPVEINLSRLQRSELQIVGVMQYTREDFLNGISLLEKDKIRWEEIVTNHYPLENLSEAFSYIDEHPQDVLKVAVTIS